MPRRPRWSRWRRSGPPRRAARRRRAAPTSSSGWAGSRRSAGWATARPPAPAISSARPASGSSRRAATSTAQPASASPRAMIAPRPEEAPVTIAAWPSRRKGRGGRSRHRGEGTIRSATAEMMSALRGADDPVRVAVVLGGGLADQDEGHAPGEGDRGQERDRRGAKVGVEDDEGVGVGGELPGPLDGRPREGLAPERALGPQRVAAAGGGAARHPVGRGRDQGARLGQAVALPAALAAQR